MKKVIGRRTTKLREDPGTRSLSFNILATNSYEYFYIPQTPRASLYREFSASNEYILGGIHHDAGSQVRIGECRTSGGAWGAKRALIEEGASKVPLPSPPANATSSAPRHVRASSATNPVGSRLLSCKHTATSLSSFATTDSLFNSILAHAINILLPPHTRIKAIFPRVRAIVSRIVTTTVLARPATILGPHAFAWASTSLPSTRTIAATENASINLRGRNKLVQAGRSIALIGLVDFSGLDHTLGTNTHDQASSGLDPSLP